MNYFIPLLFSLAFFIPAPASPVPIEKEPRHPLKFENQYVRVFNVFIPPGDTTLFHIHKNDGISVRLTEARLKDEEKGAIPVDIAVLKRGAVSFAYRPRPLIHRVFNIGDTPFHNIFVEILPSTEASSDTSSNSSSLKDVAGYTLVLENERIRVFRLVLAPGQTTELHTHALRVLSVAVSQGKVAVEVMGKKRKKAKFKPGDTQWYESGTKHSLKNIGSTTFEAVDIELR